jgi:MFS family permease
MQHTHELQHSRVVEHTPFFYGWVVWAVATINLMASAPGNAFSISLFIDPFIAEFNLDRTTASGLFGLATFLGGFGLTWIGRQIDYRGARVVGVGVSICFALTLLAFSVIINPLALFFCLIAARGLGQGGMSLLSATAVAQWFRRRRAFVMSLALVGFALFQSQYVPGLERLIANVGWRQAWLIMGVIVAVVTVPIMFFFMRNHPEDFGLVPDGYYDRAAKDFDSEDNWTLREAMRTVIFWIFIFGRFISPAWGAALVLHQASLFATLGYDRQMAAQTFGLTALTTAVVTLFSGWLITRIRPGQAMAIQLSALIVTLGLAMIMTERWLVVVYALCYGIASGNGGVFDSTVWANLFGRRHIGQIRGFAFSILVIGTAVGPVLFGLSYDKLGGYHPVLWLGIVLSLIPLILTFFVNKPRRRFRAEDSGKRTEDIPVEALVPANSDLIGTD